MYRLEWVERRELDAPVIPSVNQVVKVSLVVWKLGWMSFLTDISYEKFPPD